MSILGGGVQHRDGVAFETRMNAVSFSRTRSTFLGGTTETEPDGR